MSRYQKVKLLGRGGMGEVWQVHDRELDCDWAMKLLYPDADPAAQQAFALEIAILTKLNHPGIPRIVDKVAQENGVIMDLVEGISLNRYAQPITEEQLIDWGTQLLHILAHIHERGVLYLDCKPANMMLDENGRLHLVDFGIACWKQRQDREKPHYGTVGFAPQEQYESGILDERCDIYAFGKTLIALSLGIRCGEQLRSLRGSDMLCTQRLRYIIDSCVQEETKRRYPNTATLLDEWEHMCKYGKKVDIGRASSARLMYICLALGTICYLLSFSQWFLDHHSREERFETAMRERNYSLAIHLNPRREEPYEQLYEAVFNDSLQNQAGASSMENLHNARFDALEAMRDHGLDVAICDDEFLYRIARDALLTTDGDLLVMAENAVNHMEESNLRSLLLQLCEWRRQPLFASKEVDKRSATWMMAAKQDEHFIELGLMAVQLYELHSLELSPSGYEHWQLWMEQLDSYRRKQDNEWMNEENLGLLYRIRADSYYQYGRYLKNTGNYEQAVVMFTRLRELEQEMRKEGLADEQVRYECGNACLYLFQEGEKQMEHLDLLDQAKAYYEAALALQNHYPQAQRGLEECQRLRDYWGEKP